MAPTHRWYDQFLDAGWARLLTPAALRLILAVGRRADKFLRTRTRLERLREEAGLPRPTFFRAKGELVRYGLLERRKIDGSWHLILPFPVPDAPQKSLSRETRRSHQRDSLVSPMRPSQHQTARRARLSANGQQKTGKQLGGKSISALQQFVRKLGVQEQEDVLAVVDVVRRAPDQLDAEAHALSRRLQSQRVLVSETEVRRLLSDALVVAQAAGLFGAQVVAVHPAPEPAE